MIIIIIIITIMIYNSNNNNNNINFLIFREGKVSEKTKHILNNKVKEYQNSTDINNNNNNNNNDEIKATKLFSTNDDVDKYNNNELNKLLLNPSGTPDVFKAFDSGNNNTISTIITIKCKFK